MFKRSARMSQLNGQRNGSANEFLFVMRRKRNMIMIGALCLASSDGIDATFTVWPPVLNDKLLFSRLICERRISSLIACLRQRVEHSVLDNVVEKC